MAGANGKITADSVAVKMKDESAEITFDDCCALRDEHNSLIGKAKSAKKRLESEPKTGDNQAALAYSIAKFLEHAKGVEGVDLEILAEGPTDENLEDFNGEVAKLFPEEDEGNKVRELVKEIGLAYQNLRRGDSGKGDKAQQNIDMMEREAVAMAERVQAALDRMFAQQRKAA